MWVLESISVGLGILMVEILFSTTENQWPGYIMALLYVATISYLIFQFTRKNALHWMRGNQFKLNVIGKKLEVDVKFLSA
jgi:hypothetical protein